MIKTQYFPIALHLYVFGAAGIGFSIAMGMTAPKLQTLIVSGVSCAMTLAGHFMMRPYVRMARGELSTRSREGSASVTAEK
jgi:hypothetical protein